MSGVEFKLSNIFGFLPNTNLYGLSLARFGLLDVLYTKVANDKYFSHICPRFSSVLLESLIMI